MQILVLDDNPDDLLQIQRVLEGNAEFAVDYLSDPFEGLARIEAGDYDILLLDIHMPGLSGFDLVGRLRASERFQWIPVIFLTGSTSTDELAESLLRGGDAVLSKPVNVSPLLQQLQVFKRTIQRHRAMQAENQSLMRQAHLDPLTGLLNRRGVEYQIQQMLSDCREHARDLSVLMIDIDHFKRFNDDHGHQDGDHAIATVAAAIRMGAERETDMIGRYGGEEFSVILPDTDATGARTVADAIRKNLAMLDLRTDSNPTGRVTISVGLASDLVPAHEPYGATSMRLIGEADSALFYVKRNGRDGVHGAHDGAPLTALSGHES